MTIELSSSGRCEILRVACAAIAHGIARGAPPAPRAEASAPELWTPRATFVTLTIDEALRGCMGTLEACRPLILDVAHSAYQAAFCDPRFPALGRGELAALGLHISILGTPEDLAFTTEADLTAQIRPFVDGVILEDGPRHRGTFLPSVWESLPEPREFLRRLKQKAGLPADYWAASLRARRYTVESIHGAWEEGGGVEFF